MEKELMNVCLGKSFADMVIVGGELVNVNTEEIYQTDIAIKNGKIAFVGKVEGLIGPKTQKIDAHGKYIIPGFIDAHIHFESSMMSVTHFANAVLPKGTTSIISDLHEIGAVTGFRGIKFMLEEAKKTSLKVFLNVPSELPFDPMFGSSGTKLEFEEIKDALSWEESVGLSEVQPFHILGYEESIIKRIDLAMKNKRTVEGHAPALLGNELQAYLSMGISSDHEATRKNEALERVRLGIDLMIREGSVATDLKEVIKVITEEKINSRHCMLVTDDEDPIDLVKLGHMDYKVRRAIEEGVDPVKAIEMVTINPAEHYNLELKVGTIAPGRYADILIVNNLRELNIEATIANGNLVSKNGKMIIELKPPDYPEFLMKTFKLKRKVSASDFELFVKKELKSVKVRVIGIKDGTLLKEAKTAFLKVQDGKVLPDIENDILKIAVVERHQATGNIANAFVNGFGLSNGAIASSIAHDHHNIVVVGTNNEDMAKAVNIIADMQGGLTIVKEEECLGILELPIGGLLANKPVNELKEKLEELIKITYELGCKLRSPFMTLSFIPLAYIPAYGISDKGLIDVINFKLVDPIIG
ncbi:MAG: adenine deaminase [Candidatus Bathyarchaeia archaeon]